LSRKWRWLFWVLQRFAKFIFEC